MKRLILILMLLCSAVALQAQNEAAAFQKFKQAREAYYAKKYKTASDLLLETKRLLGGANVRIQPMLVKSLVEIQNWPQAKKEVDDYFELKGLDRTLVEYAEMQGLRSRINSELAAEEAYYRNTASRNPRKYLDDYKRKYPYGRFTQRLRNDISKADEQAAWDKASSEQNSKAYYRYLDKYPDGKHADEARRTLKSWDDAAWEKAKDENTSKSYKFYYDYYKRGEYRSEAYSLYKKRLDDEAYESARSRNTLSSYESYLSAYPRGRHADDANAILARSYIALGEKYKRSDPKAARSYYLMYLNRYPTGLHASNARKKVKRLDWRIKLKNKPDRTYLTLEMDEYTLWPDAKPEGFSSMGLSLGTLNNPQVGGYISTRINSALFTETSFYTVDDSGEPSSSLIDDARPTGVKRYGRWDITAGITKRLFWPMWLYAGGGFSSYSEFWEIKEYDSRGRYDETNFAKNTDQSYFTFAMEAGLHLDLESLTLRSGIFTDLDQAYLTFGVGFSWKRY